ncbi:MAG: PucR family transcriptional regulator [Sciscionella sp.]
MSTSARTRPGAGGSEKVPEQAWQSVAAAAATAAGAPAELLGEYLELLAGAASGGRRPGKRELAAIRDLGRLAAEQGVGADRAVDLYLSAAWRLWRQLPAVMRVKDGAAVRAAAEAVLRVIDDAVAVLVDGHQSARRQMIRQEESLRREVIDDLLRGDADVSRMVERAEPFGLDLGRAHQVALAVPARGVADADTTALGLERVIVDRFGDRDVLVASKEGQVVVLAPGSPPTAARGRAIDLAEVLHKALTRARTGRRWRVAAGRPYPGAYGIARSYEEAREALTLAERLHLDTDVVHARDLLVYRVLGRDQAAIVDLVHDVLTGLTRSRGGAEPLLATLDAYFAASEVATEAARRLHMSVRTVTYRLAKIRQLTGYDPADPTQRFALHTAVLGARLLDWPTHELPGGS